MATDKINNYAIGDNNFESVMLTLDQTFRNKHDCYSFSATALKAGSVIEINGSLYPVTQDVTLPDMSSNKYLMAVPASDGTFTLMATSTAPTWSDSKQGFYGTSTTANYKYIALLEGSIIYKYNDRPFYVSAIYANTLDMTGNITTAGNVTCAKIIGAYNSSGIRNYTPASSTEIVIKYPTMVTSLDESCKIRIWNGISWGVYMDGVGVAALNPARYLLEPGRYAFSGAYGTTSITDIF